LNTVYIIASDLTLRASPEANGFLEAIHQALQEFIGVTILRTLSPLLMIEPDVSDAVVWKFQKRCAMLSIQIGA